MALSQIAQSELDFGSHVIASLTTDREHVSESDLALNTDVDTEDAEFTEPMAVMSTSFRSLRSQLPESNQSGAGKFARERDEDGGEPNLFVYFGKPHPTRPTDCPPMFSTTQKVILDYLDEYNLELLLQHLLALCLIRMPEDPYAFMAEHCGNMVRARTDPQKYKQLARVFYPQHVEAMYRVFDKEQNGYISMMQYQFAMQALGLVRYTCEPKGYKTDVITEETFTREACHALEALLRSFMS